MQKTKQRRPVKTAKYLHWRNGRMWVGYLEDYPDYLTQGETLKELQQNLKDLHGDLTGGRVPGVRKVSKLQIA